MNTCEHVQFVSLLLYLAGVDLIFLMRARVEVDSYDEYQSVSN